MDHDPQSTSCSFGAPNGLYSYSSAASSQPCSTPRSLSDGKVSTTMEKFLAVTLLYSYKNGNSVLFLEAGKDFVDILLSFLTLPLGGIVRLLSGGNSDGTQPEPDEAIFKMADSVQTMDDEKFCTSKKSLLDPQEAVGFVSKLLEADGGEPGSESGPSSSDCGAVYYSCGMVPHCACITQKLGRRCPRHGRKMQTLCKFVEGADSNPKNSGSKQPVEKGFVRDAGRFFVTDNLGIYPGSKSLALLQMLRVERMSLLNSLDLFIGMDEVQLLPSCTCLLFISFLLDGCF